MLDVHAPHESIQSWKGFLVHIATIVIGLLIAIAEGSQSAHRVLLATCDHIGASLEPGATMHFTLEQRDQLTPYIEEALKAMPQ